MRKIARAQFIFVILRDIAMNSTIDSTSETLLKPDNSSLSETTSSAPNPTTPTPSTTTTSPSHSIVEPSSIPIPPASPISSSHSTVESSSISIPSTTPTSSSHSIVESSSIPTKPSLSTNSSNITEVTEAVKEPLLADYLNYRDFLRAFYLYKREKTKNNHRRYNYSFFSAAANIRSPNYLRLIIEGQRNLSEEMALKFARAMQLNKEATEEFVLMVNYGQETDPMLRNQYLKSLSDFRLQKSLRLGTLNKKVMEKFPNWIGWILYAMIDQEGARFTPSDLKILLRNKASETEIQNALNKLIEAGEVVVNSETGEMKKGRTLGDASEDIPVDLIRRLQTQLMSLGLESLFQDSPVDREFGTLTLSLTKKEFEELRFQLRKFRKQVHKDNSIQRMQSKGERVYQLNLQLYPVSDSSQSLVELVSL